MKKLLLALLFTSLLASCGNNIDNFQDTEGHEEHHGKDGNSNHHEEMASTTDNTDVNFRFVEEPLKANQDTPITIQVKDKKGTAIEEFDILHEKKLHLIMVSKDLSFFRHIHPEYKGGGFFESTTQFPSGGEYKLFVDHQPQGMDATTDSSKWITVEGDQKSTEDLIPDENVSRIVDGKEVTLTLKNPVVGGETELNFHIQDAATKEPISDLELYLGAVGHVVILSEDAEEYLHVHPLDEKSQGPTAKFATTIPKNGKYKIWGQFQHKGAVFTVPFVIEIP